MAQHITQVLLSETWRALTGFHASVLDADKINEAISRAAKSFQANATRLHWFGELLFAATHEGQHYERAYTALTFQRFGVLYAEQIQGHRLLVQHEEVREAVENRSLRNAPSPETFLCDVDFMWSRAERAKTEGVRAMLGTILLMAWTTFETLAEDTWIQTLNARPRLGFVAIGAEEMPDDNDTDKATRRKAKFSIPAWLAREPGFDVNKRMGDINIGKWKFDRHNEARDAYLKVFWNNGLEVKEIFDDPDLNALHTVRNCLIHDAGIAKSETERKLKNHSKFPSINAGEAIELNGEVASFLASASFLSCKKLLAFVDEWLKNNPT